MPHADRQAQAFHGLLGDWRIDNRMLRERLAGSDEWIAFPATSRIEPILGGLGNLDRFEAELGGAPFVGLTVRLYDPVRGAWTLRWADNRTLELGRGAMEPPFVGRFDADGAGLFAAVLEVGGASINARFLWRGIGTDRPRWEQAWATHPDGPWETNWTMAFRRWHP